MQRPFDGVTILDMTHALGRYVGRLFADLGAAVIRIEPPGGLADRAALARRDALPPPPALYEFEFLNASKSCRVMDLQSEAGRAAFARLAAGAQVFLLERDGPLYEETGWLRALAPACVITAISPFGRTGPYADAPASDLTLQAAGGIAWLSGRPAGPPLRLPESQATMMTGVYAAAGTALALHDAQATGVGHLVDVSAQECIAHSLQNSVQMWDFERKISMRGGEGTRDASEDMFACKDGLMFLAAPRTLGVSWNALVAWITETGHPAGAELSHARWADRVWRLGAEAKARFRETLESFTRGYTKDELTREAIRRKIVMGPVASVTDAFGDPQLAHRDYFQDVALAGGGRARFPGAPYRLSEPVWAVSPAPALGRTEHETNA